VTNGAYIPVTELRAGVWGEIKTGKTSISLSFPKPLVHFDLDLSFERAAHRFRHFNIERLSVYTALGPILQAHQASGEWPDIIVIPYAVPVKWPGVNIHGMIAMWDAFVGDVEAAYLTPGVASLSVDTGSMVWKIATTAHLERVQINNPNRQNLIQIEYSRPNTELKGLYGGSFTHHKNLIITHHVGGVYKDQLTNKGVEQMRVGDTWDGFSGMGQIVDLVGRTVIDRNPANVPVPTLQVHSSGYTLALEGKNLEMPTFGSILVEINSLREQGL
jgi:hypothetical protein